MSLLLRKRTVSAKAALKLLDDSHAALHFNREILQTALNHVRQGIAVFDADLQLICSNRQFSEILALPPHLVQLGIPLQEILEFMCAVSASGFCDSDTLLQPLNSARLYVTSRVERQSGGEDSRLVENIDDSLEAIEEILGALLDISRLDAGAMATSVTSFKMADLMRSLEIEFAPIARAKGLKLRFVPCSLPVESDRLLLRRLLQNFISNAIKYTPRGRVLVGCRRRGQSLQVGVYDTGVGIPVLKRGEIFKEFHRLEQGARIARGLGLGLSIVERLARVLNHGIALDANATS